MIWFQKRATKLLLMGIAAAITFFSISSLPVLEVSADVPGDGGGGDGGGDGCAAGDGDGCDGCF